MMTVNEVAKLSGVSVRTLQYYDKIKLLAPAAYTESGYRLYDTANLLTLQQILLYKELGFALKDIKQLLHDPNSDTKTRLLEQKSLLLQKSTSIEAMITQVDSLLGGETTMDFEVFKQTFATKIPVTTKKEDKEKLMENITPELFERVEEVWGTKEFLDLKPKTVDDLQRYLERVNNVFSQIFDEEDETKIVPLVEEWVDASVDFAQLPDRKTFVDSMIKDYRTNEQVIAAADKHYGAGSAKHLLCLLENYALTL